MTLSVPQDVLDALTDVVMPRLGPEPGAAETVEVGAFKIPVFKSDGLVIGSGAAGLRAAVEMKRRDVDVVVVSQSAWGGTSACSGSDKQTLHTANTKDKGDNFKTMAAAIRSGGAMDEDKAYVEAVGSVRAMASLQYLGLPLPQDELGGTLRYQTDHDEVGRATSCGPRTSRLMVKVLAEEAIRLDIPIFNQTTAVKVLTLGDGAEARAAGMVAVRPKMQNETNPLGLVLFQCKSLVFAAGGPGELYRDSVFPNGCFGTLGLALETGLELVNITESQFGIGTRREGFPWNLSGTYVQVVPHIYSLDEDGKEHHFLAGYYRTTQELASNIFRKGYQWPFHASRMLKFQSSLVDLAVFRENQRGRRVFMDFNRNPLPVPDDQPFNLARLDSDVSTYLKSAGANHELPIERLRHMNPLSIELYKRYKIDITAEPLEFSVNNQHMNGGIAVDIWGRTNVGGIYAVGEAAGTHGATRPGGSALIAGQVFGTRVAEHIGASNTGCVAALSQLSDCLNAAVTDIVNALAPESEFTVRSVRTEIQARMSDKAGILCSPDQVSSARADAQTLNQALRRSGIAPRRSGETGRAIQWRQMALASEAVLAALDDYISRGGGSRGARAICDPVGDSLPETAAGPMEDVRFRAERDEDMYELILVQMVDDEMIVKTRPVHILGRESETFFERDWPAWLTGQIYDRGH